MILRELITKLGFQVDYSGYREYERALTSLSKKAAAIQGPGVAIGGGAVGAPGAVLGGRGVRVPSQASLERLKSTYELTQAHAQTMGGLQEATASARAARQVQIIKAQGEARVDGMRAWGDAQAAAAQARADASIRADDARTANRRAAARESIVGRMDAQLEAIRARGEQSRENLRLRHELRRDDIGDYRELGALYFARNVLNQVAGFGLSKIRMAGEFRAGEGILGVLADADVQQVEALSETALSIGSNLRAGAMQAQEAMLLFAQSGLTAAQIQAATRPILQLVQSEGNISPQEAASFMVNIITNFQKGADEIEKTANQVAGVSDAVVGGFADLGSGMRYASGAFVQAKRPFEEMLLLLGLLAQAGLRGSVGGTSLNMMMRSLTYPTRNANAVLRRHNIELRDAQGNMRSVIDIMKELKNAQLTAEESRMLFPELRSQRAFAGLMRTIDRVDALTVAMNRTDVLARKIAASMKNSAAAFDVLMNAIDALSIRVGKSGLDEDLASLLQTMTGIIQVAQNLPPSLLRVMGATVALGTAAGLASISLRMMTLLFGTDAFVGIGGALAARGGLRALGVRGIVGAGSSAVAAHAAGTPGAMTAAGGVGITALGTVSLMIGTYGAMKFVSDLTSALTVEPRSGKSLLGMWWEDTMKDPLGTLSGLEKTLGPMIAPLGGAGLYQLYYDYRAGSVGAFQRSMLDAFSTALSPVQPPPPVMINQHITGGVPNPEALAEAARDAVTEQVTQQTRRGRSTALRAINPRGGR